MLNEVNRKEKAQHIFLIHSIFLFIKNFELKKFTIFLDYFSIIILNYYFTPLIAFTIYFCFLHSIRHSISLMIELDQNNLKNGLLIFFKKALPLTILTAIFCLIGMYFLNKNYGFDNSILRGSESSELQKISPFVRVP